MKTQTKLLAELRARWPELTFKPGDTYYWSPGDNTVFYQADDTSEVGLWTILHETCHGILGHTNYQSDFELVMLEVSAWDHAKRLAEVIGITIDNDHIQDCLDSYRDWQYKRSLCPRCDLGGIQITPSTYTCIFCHDTWNVSKERFFRPYRRSV